MFAYIEQCNGLNREYLESIAHLEKLFPISFFLPLFLLYLSIFRYLDVGELFSYFRQTLFRGNLSIPSNTAKRAYLNKKKKKLFFYYVSLVNSVKYFGKATILIFK